MTRKASDVHIAGGVDQLTAAAIAAAIAQQLEDEAATAAIPKKRRNLSKWTKPELEETSYVTPKHSNR